MAESKIIGNPEIPISSKTTLVRFIFARLGARRKPVLQEQESLELASRENGRSVSGQLRNHLPIPNSSNEMSGVVSLETPLTVRPSWSRDTAMSESAMLLFSRRPWLSEV